MKKFAYALFFVLVLWGCGGSMSDKKDITILFTGDSMTENQYPRHIKEYLPQRNITVIDKALSATTTLYGARRIEGWLDEYKPDIVVCMYGINDIAISTKANYAVVPFWAKFAKPLWKLKLNSFTPPELTENLADPTLNTTDNPSFIAAVHFRTALDARDGVAVENVLKNPANDWLFFLNIIFLKHEMPEVYENIKNLYLNLDITIFNDFARHAGFRAMYYFENENFDEAKKYFKMQTDYLTKNVNINVFQNYNVIFKAADKRGIKFIAVQYPVRELEPLKNMLSRKAVFVSNEKNFKDAIIKSGYDSLFVDANSGDFGHSTPESNKLIAENLAKTLNQVLE
jgi:hypothetical protein